MRRNLTRFASTTALLFVALFSTPAFAQGATCLSLTTTTLAKQAASAGETLNPSYVKGGLEDQNRGGVDSAAALIAQNINDALPAHCRPHTANNIKAYAGLGQPSEPDSKPDSVAAPTLAPAGGGAILDQQIAELKALILTGGNNPAEMSALKAQVARLEAKRSQGPDLRPQIRRLEQQLGRLRTRPASTLNGGDRKRLAALPGQIEAMQKAQADAAASATSAAEDAEIANGAATQASAAATEAKKSATAAEEAAGKSGGWLLPKWWWFGIFFIIFSVILGLVTWWLAARTDNVREELHARVDRVTDDVHLSDVSEDALSNAVPGSHIKVIARVNGHDRYQLTFKKVNNIGRNGQFETSTSVGDTPAGQNIGDVLTFIRRAHMFRRNQLRDFLIPEEA